MSGTLRIRQSEPPQIVLPMAAEAPRPEAAAAGSMLDWRILLALFALPMFAQCFQYMIDVLPLYALSKVWPFLMLPLFVWALLRLDLPFRILQVVTLIWVLAVTPVIGIVQLGNDAVAAFATTIKVWPFTYAFSLAGLLVVLRVSAPSLRRVVLWLGVATYVIMLALWLVAPTRAYGGGDVVTKLFMYDPERGYHLYMPMFFGMLLVFTLNRSFWATPRVWKLAAIGLAFALQFWIYKERAAIGCGLLTVIVGAALSTGRWRPLALSLLALGAGAAAFYALGRMQDAAELHASLGGSLAVRRVSVMTAWNFLSTDPTRWLFGIGATTRFGDITLAQLFGNRMFFLTDIGWLGVVFEYGVIGASLMLLVHGAGLFAATRWSKPDDPLSRALADYVLYLLLVSGVYSVVFTPGELTTVIGLSYYLARSRRLFGQRAGDSQPDSSSPRHIALARPNPSGRFSLRAPAGWASNG